jgi:microcystin-dependent protein
MLANASLPSRLAPAAIAICVAAFAALAIFAVTALGAGQPRASGLPKDADLLFALGSESGKFEKSKDQPKRTFRLELRDLDAAALWFTNRPQRDTGTIPTPRFFRVWEQLGFEDDPPNAVVSLVRGPDRADKVALELRRPRLSRSGSRLRLTVKLLDEASPDLAHLADDLDRRLQRRFDDVTLFIDDASIASAPCTLGDINYMPGETFKQWEFPNLMRANARLLPVEEFPALFAAIGTRFGGDGQESFALPEVDGPAPGVYAFICTDGEPAQAGGQQSPACLVGEIRTTADLRVVPVGWLPTDGRTLQISEHPTLYSLIGSSFGGDGETTYALPTLEPSDGLSNQICYFGTFPTPNRRGSAGRVTPRGNGVPTAGVIGNQFQAGLRLRASNFPPVTTAMARGQLLPISQNTALFELMGTTFGGDGRSYFSLPDVPSPQPDVPAPGAPMLNWIVNLHGIFPPRG